MEQVQQRELNESQCSRKGKKLRGRAAPRMRFPTFAQFALAMRGLSCGDGLGSEGL